MSRSAARPMPGVMILGVLPLAMAFLLAPDLAGQQTALTGAVVDAESGHPIAGAHVHLGEGAPPAAAVTDAEGRFRFEDLAPGARTLRVEVAGFEAARRSISLHAEETMELTIELRPEVVELAELVVDVEGSRGVWLREDLEHLVRQHGKIFTRSDIERWNVVRLPNLFHRVPGVMARFYENRLTGREELALTSAGRRCEAQVYLDGSRVPAFVLNQVPPQQVAAVGILARPTSTAAVDCGLISIVTRAAASAGADGG